MKNISKFIVIINLISCNNETHFDQGLNQRDNGNYKEAIDLFTEEIETNPSNEYAYYERFITKYKIDKFNGALDDINQAIEIKEHSAFYNNRCVINIRLGNYDRAIKDATQAIKLKRDYVDAYVNRAGAYGMQNKHTKSIEDYSFALKLDPQNTIALSNRGASWEKLGNLKKACDDWLLAAELGGGESELLLKKYCK